MQDEAQQFSAEDDSRECQSDDCQFVHDHSKDAEEWRKKQTHDAPPDTQLPTTEQAGARDLRHF